MASPGSQGLESSAVEKGQQARPKRRSILLRIALLAAIVGFVFVVLLPRIVDYDAVRAALAGLTVGQLAALIGATAVAYALNAGPARVLVPGMSWRRAVEADLVGRAAASTIPGPTDVAVKSLLFRQWTIPLESANAGLVLASFFEPLSSLMLPLIATIAVVVTGQSTSPRVLGLTIVGMVVLALAAFGLQSIVRSEAMARKVGERLDGWARRIWSWFRRTPPAGIVEGVLAFRTTSSDILSRRGLLGFGAAVAAKLGWFVVLELCLAAVGIEQATLPPAAVLAAMAGSPGPRRLASRASCSATSRSPAPRPTPGRRRRRMRRGSASQPARGPSTRSATAWTRKASFWARPRASPADASSRECTSAWAGDPPPPRVATRRRLTPPVHRARSRVFILTEDTGAQSPFGWPRVERGSMRRKDVRSP